MAGNFSLMLSGAVWIRPLLSKMDYDPVKDLIPITGVSVAPAFLFEHPSVPAKNVSELIALAKSKPGELRYGMAGQGTSSHLGSELFNSMAGITMVRVAYSATGQIVDNLLTNDVQVGFSNAQRGMPHVAAGRLRVLGVGSIQRSVLAPDVPTIASQGLPGFEVGAEMCLWVPAGTPKAAVTRLSEAALRVLANPEVKKKLLSNGYETVGTTPEQAAAHIQADIAKWSMLVK